MLVAWLAVAKVRVEEHLLLVARRINELLPATVQRLCIRSDDLGAARHYARAVVAEQVIECRIGRPRSDRPG
jgi:hypothetical protein